MESRAPRWLRLFRAACQARHVTPRTLRRRAQGRRVVHHSGGSDQEESVESRDLGAFPTAPSGSRGSWTAFATRRETEGEEEDEKVARPTLVERVRM